VIFIPTLINIVPDSINHKMASKILRERDKKQARRRRERIELKDFDMKFPVAPKKPSEFKFDKDNIDSFEYPVAIGNRVIEKKSDGYCVLLSVNNEIKMYSSNLNEWDIRCFPEVSGELVKLPHGYYHGELLGLKNADRFTSLDEYTAIQKRPKTNINDVTKELIEKYPLKIDIFDSLIIEDKAMLSKPLVKRRAVLEDMIEETEHVNLIHQWKVNNKEDLQKLFLWAIDNNYEGLIAKDPLSFYVPGSRDNDWIKLKEFLTLDLAVLGFYSTESSKRLGKPFAAVLVGSYNTETCKFETVAKVKIGAIKKQEEIYQRIKHLLCDKADNVVFSPEMLKIKKKIPEKVVKYGSDIVILEVQTQDITYNGNWHSCGLENEKAHSLRLPTFKQLRKDKTRISDVTTTQQIHDYYFG